MLKFVLFFLMTVFFSACGVDTSSSPAESSGTVLTDSDLVISDPIDSNPVVQDPGTDEPGTSDPGTSDPGTSDPGTSEPAVNPSKSYFDTVDAIEDPNACNSSFYNFVRDASYGGEQDGENSASSVIIDGQGLVVRSEYLSQDYATTWVTLFYKPFPTPDNLGLQGVSSYKMENVFYISYDLAWADESIPNINNRVYIQSDKGEKPACYRLDLNNIVGSQLDVQKVYRLRL